MKRFLVIDDDKISRWMLRDFLSKFNPCDVAENGKEGLLAFETALAEGNPYSLLCVDLMMPEMNGHALIRKIRELEKKNPLFADSRTKIFVVTASDSTWDKAELLLEDLCDDYIVKPFNRDSLKTKLRYHGLVHNNPTAVEHF
jgi:two-component system chemotaxis response regulator CheY